MALITRSVADSVVAIETPSFSTRYFRPIADAQLITDAIVGQLIEPLRISAARALRSTRVRLDFNTQLSLAGSAGVAAADPDSYAFSPLTPGAVAIFAQAVDFPPGQTQPAFIEVDVNEMTDGANYSVAIVGALKNVGGYGPSSASHPLLGKGESPTILYIRALSKNQIQVQFTEQMADNAALRNPSSYEFSGGLVVNSVLAVEGSRVTLGTSDQTPGTLYTLTVHGKIPIESADIISASDSVTRLLL
jgi:hypothetical protein